MKIVVHAGMHKTGTTAFQAALKSQKSPQVRTFGPDTFRFTVNSDRFDQRWVRDKIEGAERDGIETVIFSHEELSLVNADGLAVFTGFASRHELKYVVTFRHWCSYLPSRWSQNCKRLDSQPFKSFLERVDQNTPRRAWVDFSEVVSTAERAGFDGISILSYDDAVKSGGIIPALQAACDLPARLNAAKSTQRNTSPEWLRVEVIRLFNGVRSERKNQHLNGLQERLENGGTGIPCLDQVKSVDRVMDANPNVAAELHGLIEDSAETITLERSRFTDLEQRLNQVAAKFRPEPVFSEVDEKARKYSALYISDLPAAFRRDIWVALRKDLNRDMFTNSAVGRRLSRWF
ncbi:MAG: hypothetical protein R8F89_07105 [Roseobacter sp.]|nr:hypothetical protein [Roseobacter sp.]